MKGKTITIDLNLIRMRDSFLGLAFLPTSLFHPPPLLREFNIIYPQYNRFLFERGDIKIWSVPFLGERGGGCPALGSSKMARERPAGMHLVPHALE